MLRADAAGSGALPAIYKDAEIILSDMDTLDLADEAEVRAYMENERPALIFNCAAYTNVDGAETAEEEAYRANATGPKNLAMAAEALGAKLVHVSTDYVFDGKGTKPYVETDKPAPRSAYGRTKLAGEEFVQKNCSRAFILRTAWLYGHGGKNFVYTMLRLGRERGVLQVVNDQRGCPTYANDLARAMLLLAAGESYGLYHAAGGGACSWYEFAREILRLGGVKATLSPCTSAEFPSPVQRPAWSVLDCGKLEAATGFRMPGWQDALARFFQREDE